MCTSTIPVNMAEKGQLEQAVVKRRLSRAFFGADQSESRMGKFIRLNMVGKELRPKNHGVMAIYSFSNLARDIEENETLTVLYFQAQRFLGDSELEVVLNILKENPGITGINLGENPAVSAEGWRKFIDGVGNTSLIDCYAQPTGGGPDYDECRRLKDAILRNRLRDGVEMGRHPSMWRACDYCRKKRKRR